MACLLCFRCIKVADCVLSAVFQVYQGGCSSQCECVVGHQATERAEGAQVLRGVCGDLTGASALHQHTPAERVELA